MPLEVSTGPGWIRLAGEVDLSNVEVLRKVLHSEAKSGSSITIDLSGLEFLDAGGAHVFDEVAEVPGVEEVRLVGARGLPRKVIELTGLSHRPNILLL